MTGPVLNHSKGCFYLGGRKRRQKFVKKESIEAAPQYPASHIQPPNGEVLWMIDTGAAKYVNGK
jgi:hypothetical protein